MRSAAGAETAVPGTEAAAATGAAVVAPLGAAAVAATGAAATAPLGTSRSLRLCQNFDRDVQKHVHSTLCTKGDVQKHVHSTLCTKVS